MANELVDFVARAIEKGVERPAIATALTRAGWPHAEIEAALATFADVEFPLAVPRPRPYLSAWEFFIYLILFVALYTAAYSLGALLFEFVNVAVPDPLQRRSADSYFYDQVRWNLSLLLVSFPLFLFAFHVVSRAIGRDPTKRGSRARKWLTYMTLFIAAVSLICDVTSLLYNVLGGEFTIRFGLKIAVVAVIAGGIFLFFLIDMKQDEVP